MKLSTKGRYAVTAMMDIANRGENKLVTLAEISQTQGISNSYLEQLFTRLRRNKLVKGVRGPHGGYRLARPAEEITVAEIIRAVDEEIDATRCAGRGNCQDGERCLSHELWSELSNQLYAFLSNITLAQYVQRPSVKLVFERQRHEPVADRTVS